MEHGTHRLVLHPQMQCGVVESVEAKVDRSGNELTVAFTVTGRTRRIRVPQRIAPERTDFLWQHTCFEAFVAPHDSPAYHELNLSPSTQWAVYSFSSYREIESLGEDPAVVEIVSLTTPEHLQLLARIDLRRLAARYVDAPLRLALSAVIEDSDGQLSYWSLHHPPGQPDFHHADAFRLGITADCADSGITRKE